MVAAGFADLYGIGRSVLAVGRRGLLWPPRVLAGGLIVGRFEDAPWRIRLRAGRGQRQLRGSEPSAAPARQ